MKVLLLTDPMSDYGAAYIYHGLCEYLGGENVYDYPIKYCYHGRTHVYHVKGEQRASGVFHWWTGGSPFGDGYTWEIAESVDAQFDIVRSLLRQGQFSFVVIGSTRSVAWDSFSRLHPDIQSTGIPVAFHDGSDYLWFNKSTLAALGSYRVDVVLKREFPKSVLKAVKGARVQVAGDVPVEPFPFSYPVSDESVIPDTALTFDVVSIHGLTNRERLRVTKALRVFSAEGFVTYIALQPDEHSDNKPMVGWPEYMATYRAARVGVSVRGCGFDACRHWEVPAMTCMARDALDIVIPNDFVHGETAIIFGDSGTCVKEIRSLLKDPIRRQAIYEAGRAHLLKYHTNRARAEWLCNYMTHGVKA